MRLCSVPGSTEQFWPDNADSDRQQFSLYQPLRALPSAGKSARKHVTDQTAAIGQFVIVNFQQRSDRFTFQVSTTLPGQCNDSLRGALRIGFGQGFLLPLGNGLVFYGDPGRVANKPVRMVQVRPGSCNGARFGLVDFSRLVLSLCSAVSTGACGVVGSVPV